MICSELTIKDISSGKQDLTTSKKVNPRVKIQPAVPASDLQSNCANWLQEILGRLDDLQKLRSILDIESRMFKKEVTNLKTFKTEIENLLVQAHLNEQLRITKENNNLSLLSKANEKESKRQNSLNSKSSRITNTSNIQLKLECKKSYISSLISNAGASWTNLKSLQDNVQRKAERSYSSNKNEGNNPVANNSCKYKIINLSSKITCPQPIW